MNEHTPEPGSDMIHRLGLGSGAKNPFRRRLWLGAIVLVMVALGLYWAFGGRQNVSYVTAKVTRGSLTVVVNATGTLQPQDQVDVGAEISGRVDHVLVDFNDHVKKGQILVELNTDQLKAKRAQSEAALASARANVRQYEATLTQARNSAARTEALFKRNAIAKQDLETAQADLQRAQANLQKANADASLAEAQLAADTTTLEKAIIRSPIDGVVLNRTVEPGQTVAASLQTPVLLTLASDLSQMQLQVDIDEADIGSVKEGQSATFAVDAFPQQRFNARLVSLHNAPKTANGVVTYQGVLVVDNASGVLRPGLTATADILVAAIKDALLVPNGALRYTPPTSLLSHAVKPPPRRKGQRVGRVWVLEKGKPSPRDLVIGRSDGRATEVLSGTLSEGESVITDAATSSGTAASHG